MTNVPSLKNWKYPAVKAEKRVSLFQRLTKREVEVLEMISYDNTYEETAQKLCISLETVKSHRKNIGRKLDVRTNSGLIRKAFELGFLRT